MNTIETFYPALIGGGLIALSCLILMLALGKIAGISGIFFSTVFQSLSNLKQGQYWQIAFIVGLVIGGTLYTELIGISYTVRTNFPLWMLIIAGLLVGYGTQLGNGCTSGHGICGISRFSKRSISATIIFMSTAILTVYFSRHIITIFS